MVDFIPYYTGETYTSIRATPNFIGRTDELKDIEKAIRQGPRSYLVYITGEGGIGKTRLLLTALEKFKDQPGLLVADELVDLYHTAMRTTEGLMAQLYKVLFRPDVTFDNYTRERAVFDMLVVRSDERHTLREQREKMELAFLYDLSHLAQKYRIVLALDTAEKLFIEKGMVSEWLGEQERPDVFTLLLRRLAALPNMVVLLAGRRESEAMFNRLKRDIGERLLEIRLSGLLEDEALAYFKAVEKELAASDKEQDQQAAEYIHMWTQDERRAIFHALREDDSERPGRTSGTARKAKPQYHVRPIRLALAIDHRIMAEATLPELVRPKAESLTSKDRETIQKELGRELVKTLHSYRRAADEAILALAWLRKGATPELIARITGVVFEEACHALEELKDLSFVKVRGDDRIFLHDEMYDWLNQYVRQSVSPVERERVFTEVRAYYDKQIRERRQAVERWYREANVLELPEDTRPLDQYLIAQAIENKERLQDALVEDLFYRLHWNALDGFKTFCRYSDEAIAEQNEALDMQLRDELLSFLRARDAYNPHPKNPQGQLDALADANKTVDGLRIGDIRADAALRRFKRLSLNPKKRAEAQELAQDLRIEKAELIEAGGDLAAAELDTLEAELLTYNGQLKEAQQKLERALDTLLKLKASHGQDYRYQAVLAKTYNNWGYLLRVLGQVTGAVEDYKRALPYWRHLKIEAEHANTLTNLAYALALSGNFDAAIRNATDALSLRMRLGRGQPVALSYNTLGEIEIRAGNAYDAEVFVEKARRLAHNIELVRIEGLALLTAASLHRYRSEDVDLSTTQRRYHLEEGLKKGNQALEIFRGAMESERLVQAYYETGVTYRALSRVAEDENEQDEYFRQAVARLEQARRNAREHSRPLWTLYLDATLGLAWTYYYARQFHDLRTVLDDIYGLIRTEFKAYVIHGQDKPIIGDDMIVEAFTHFGRFHVLLGMQAMDRFKDKGEGETSANLREAAQQFALAIAYNRLFAENHQGLRRALTTIHDRLKILNTRELATFLTATQEELGKLGEDLKDSRWWQELENAFGPYDTVVELAGQSLPLPS